MKLVLMHELAHLRRHDNLTLLLLRLISVPVFFYPSLWLCGHMLRLETLGACNVR
ncbi:MAG: M56 family metallopeptidase [Candidatus Latescibacterota bacterium]|nr:M56 family metallopeptidase [Candidatus Latescibacterota bacterium]